MFRSRIFSFLLMLYLSHLSPQGLSYLAFEICEEEDACLDQDRIKHLCLQYPEWKKLYSDFCDTTLPMSLIDESSSNCPPRDYSEKREMIKKFYLDRIKLIEKIAIEADQCLYEYIIKGVTEGKSYTYLKTVLGIPCGKDMYYDRYRKFFWLLSRERM